MFEKLLNNEIAVGIALSMLGSLWAYFKASQWYQDKIAAKHARAADAVEAGVVFAYTNFVRNELEKIAGKLPVAKQAEARGMAKKIAQDIGKEQGIDVLATLGPDFFDMYVERAVKAAKGKSK